MDLKLLLMHAKVNNGQPFSPAFSSSQMLSIRNKIKTIKKNTKQQRVSVGRDSSELERMMVIVTN